MTPDSDDTDGEPPRIPGSKKGMIMFQNTGVLQNLRSTFTEACGFEEPDFLQHMSHDRSILGIEVSRLAAGSMIAMKPAGGHCEDLAAS